MDAYPKKSKNSHIWSWSILVETDDHDPWSSRESDYLEMKPPPSNPENDASSLFSNFPFFKDAPLCNPQYEERSEDFLSSSNKCMREFLMNEPKLNVGAADSFNDSRQGTSKSASPSYSHDQPTPFPSKPASRRFNKSDSHYSSSRRSKQGKSAAPFPHAQSAPLPSYHKQHRKRELPPGISPGYARRASSNHHHAPPGIRAPFPGRATSSPFPVPSGLRSPTDPTGIPRFDPNLSRSPLCEMDRQAQKMYQNLAEAKTSHKKKKRKHANYFVALQITNPSIKKKISAIQTALKNRSADLQNNMIPAETLHLVVGTLNLPSQSDLWKAVEGFTAFGEKKLHGILPSKTSCRLNIEGIENFKNRVLYATMPEGDPKATLKRIHLALRAHFQEIGIQGEYHKKFEPHLIICKTDGTIKEDVLDCLGDFSMNFGFQFIHRLDFCAKSATDFRYKVMTSIEPKRPFGFI